MKTKNLFSFFFFTISLVENAYSQEPSFTTWQTRKINRKKIPKILHKIRRKS